MLLDIVYGCIMMYISVFELLYFRINCGNWNDFNVGLNYFLNII